MTAKERRGGSLTPRPLTRRQRDERFLARTFDRRWFNEREEELIRALVARYHDAAYGDINELLCARTPLAPVTLLDNYAYLMERLGGPDSDGDNSPTMVYHDTPDALRELRRAPLDVRRAVLAAARLRRALCRADVPLRHWAAVSDSTPLGLPLASLAERQRGKEAEIARLVEQQPELTLGRVERIVADQIAAPLLSGAL